MIQGAIADLLSDRLDLYAAQLHGAAPADLHSLVVGTAEAAVLQWSMLYTEGNKSLAAEYLGLARTTLDRKLAQHGIS